MLKIKKEGEEGDDPQGIEREQRERKRPSFFQEFENEENNLDKILDEFEQEQMEEAKKPKPEKKERPPGYVPKKRKRREDNSLVNVAVEPRLKDYLKNLHLQRKPDLWISRLKAVLYLNVCFNAGHHAQSNP